MINFIGLGAQKSGTSWAYACLYEHPQICAPVKEIHFFSRERFKEGKAWYESHFKNCNTNALKGEFSTSYLYSEEAPERIHAYYPNAKLIAILRNPITRAYSQYRNAIKAGEIPESIGFEEYTKKEASAINQGLYALQLQRYYEYFDNERILVLIYEDIQKDPIAFMRRIYKFLGVDPEFVSSMVHDEINVSRTPKSIGIERVMHHVAEFMRRHGLDRVVHRVRKSGVTDLIRAVNTKKEAISKEALPYERTHFVNCFRKDVKTLSGLIGRDMRREWDI